MKIFQIRSFLASAIVAFSQFSIPFLLFFTVISSTQALGQCSTPVSLPYYNDFENESVNTLPACTNGMNVSGNRTFVVANGADAYQGNKYLDMSATIASDSWLFLPAMNFVAGQPYQLSFFYNCRNIYTYWGRFDVYIGNSPTVAAMTKLVVNAPISASDTAYTELATRFSTPGGQYYIGIYFQSFSGTSRLLMDNLGVSPVGDCSGLVSLPYFKDFESDSIGLIPSCFTVQTSGPASRDFLSPEVRSGAAAQGTKFLHLFSTYDPSQIDGWMFLPAFNFIPGKNYKISFKYRGYNNAPSNADPFSLYYGSAPVSTSMNVLLGSTNNWPNTYQVFERNFTAVTNSNYIGLHYQNTWDMGNALYIDELLISEILPEVTGVSPATVCAGLPVTITGTGLGNTVSVKVGNIAADSIQVISPTSVNAIFKTAVSGNISVTNQGGTTVASVIPLIVKFAPTVTLTGPACLGGGDIIATLNAPVKKLYWRLGYSGPMPFNPLPTIIEWQLQAKTPAGGNGQGTAPNQLNTPFGIFQDVAGNLYVADAANHRIQKFTPGNTIGITVAGGNGVGAAPNQLNNPRGAMTDLEGNIYVADAGNNRIQKWEPGAVMGVTVAGGNGAGMAANQFNFPHGIIVDLQHNLYVADGNNNRIQKFTSGATDGITVAGGNGAGSAANQLSYPTGVYADTAGNVYVSDFTNNRVQKWLANSVTGITVAGGNGQGNAANQLDAPRGLYVDKYENVYVADQNNNRIQKWIPGATTGMTVGGGSGFGLDSNQLAAPAAVFGDDNDSARLFVADRLNHRIQEFYLPRTAALTPRSWSGGAYWVSKFPAWEPFVGCDIQANEFVLNDNCSASICPGSNTFFMSGNSTSGNTYQWQVNRGEGFENILNGAVYKGVANDTLWLIQPPTSWYGYAFRCVINNSSYSQEYILKFVTSWGGLVNPSWLIADNWTCGRLPDENTDVIIGVDFRSPFIGSGEVGRCRSLKLLPGTSLYLSNNGQLIIKKPD